MGSKSRFSIVRMFIRHVKHRRKIRARSNEKMLHKNLCFVVLNVKIILYILLNSQDIKFTFFTL